jgi:tetratricopeptide (TPR) repeat protein
VLDWCCYPSLSQISFGVLSRIIDIWNILVGKIIMSSSGAEADVVCCANCGVAEVDDIQLEDCDGCDLVKYCGDKCREENREQHDEDCKKRATKLHDKKLFNQPDGSCFGECPLCFLPMPLDPEKTTFYSCCSKIICDGFVYAHHVKSNGGYSCPFCREPDPGDEEFDKRMMKRVKANDPAVMREVGTRRHEEGDWDIALEYWTKAAELGDVDAHYQLADSYSKGEGVERDDEKGVYHYEKAAMDGHPHARYNLGEYEEEKGNMERAVKHFIIAANLGYEDSMKELWEYYKDGYITKENLEATLRTHQAALDEMKSPEREVAAAWRKRGSPLPGVVTAQRG